MDAEFDVIVLGAGVQGSATAYNLVKTGAGRVLLLEQVSFQKVGVFIATVQYRECRASPAVICQP